MAGAAAALLDELMGPQRNLAADAACDVTFEDEHVCRYALIGFCPHELFTNTRSDIGPCRKSHDKRFKEQYEQSEKRGRLGYEEEFETVLRRLQNDMQRKIDKNNERLRLSNGQLSNMQIIAQREKVEEKVRLYNTKIVENVQLAESCRKDGRTAEAEKADEAAERCRQDLASVQRVMNSLNTDGPDPDKPQEMVCDVCGCFLIKNDVQCRMDEHNAGKLHMGFAKIRVTIEELEKRRGERRKPVSDDRAKRKSSPKARSPQERERERDRDREHSSKRERRSDERKSSRSSQHKRRSRSRSSSRHRRHKSSSGKHADKDRDGKGKRDKDKERERKRDRSTSRHRDRDDERKSTKRRRRSNSGSKSPRPPPAEDKGPPPPEPEAKPAEENGGGGEAAASAAKQGTPGGDCDPQRAVRPTDGGFEDTAPLDDE